LFDFDGSSNFILQVVKSGVGFSCFKKSWSCQF